MKKNELINGDLLAEYLCVSKCVSALETLGRYHTNQSSKGDSIAEGRANRAGLRCLQWLVSFKVKDAFIAAKEVK
jgi:hypothetical protein